MGDDVVRRVAIRQLMTMDAAALVERAQALQSAPPVPPAWVGTPAETALAEQADLAMALAPLRVEFGPQQWADLADRLDRGEDLAAAARAVRSKRS